MPRDIGPDMLRNLDEQFAAGRIDQASYDARKVEVLELIRKGRAVEYSRTQRTWKAVRGALAWIAGGWVALNTGNLAGVLLGIGLIIVGFLAIR